MKKPSRIARLRLTAGAVAIAVATTGGVALARHKTGPAACGVERWTVKVGTDSGARLVSLTPVASSVAALVALPPPVSPSARVVGVETEVFQLHATATAYKEEADSDIHLALDDGAGHSMIAEIPDPHCMGNSPFKAAVTTVRATWLARHPASTSFVTQPEPVTLTGVGFWDKLHNQRGVAPNGIELHPLLSLNFG